MSIRPRRSCRGDPRPHSLAVTVSRMLRRATQADIEVMAAIHAAAFAPADAWSAELFDLQLAMPNIFGLLHQKGGLILAQSRGG